MRKVLIADITIPSQGGKSQIARSSRAYTITSRTLLTAQSCRQYSQDETRGATNAQRLEKQVGYWEMIMSDVLLMVKLARPVRNGMLLESVTKLKL